jgi:dipeptidyl aminopeptidase/acylaminoacyl peptidase
LLVLTLAALPAGSMTNRMQPPFWQKSDHTHVRPQEPKKPYPYLEKEISFENKRAGVRLVGTLTVPLSGGHFPAVILIPGSGAQDRDGSPVGVGPVIGHKRLLVMADYLTRQGLAVLRMDKRGVGQSTGDLLSTSSADSASDIVAGVKFLRNHGDIDAKQIGLVGLSEGGTIAAMAATKSNDVAFVILMATPGLVGEKALHLQYAALLRAYGATNTEIVGGRAAYEKIYAVIETEKKNSIALEKLSEYVNQEIIEVSDDLKRLETVKLDSRFWLPLVTPWYRFLLTYDPYPTLKRMKQPVLVMNGERDLQVPYEENLSAIEAALVAGGNKDYMIVHLPNLNHLFQTSRSGLPSEYSELDETIAPAALRQIFDWIHAHTSSH